MTGSIRNSLVALLLLTAGATHSYTAECSRRWFVMGGVEGSLRKVVAVSKDDIWLSGRSSGLWHYDGESLSRVLPETIRFGADAFDVTGNGEIWIQTHESVGREQVLLHLKNGKAVHCSQTVKCGWIQDIDMINEDEGWAVGNNGALLRCTGHTWEIVESGYSNFLYDVEFLDESYGWMVGTEGFLAEYDGGEWKVVDQGLPSVNFRSVSIVRWGDVWVAGDKGTILHLSNGSWHTVESPTRNDLHCIRMTDPEHGWIGSFSGEIAEYRDSSWRLCNSPVSGQLNGLDTCQGNVWFVLRSGEVVRNLTKEVPQFRDGTIDHGLVYKGTVFSPHVVDLNGDGREDLYVETRDEEDLVYFNQGDRFERPLGGTGIERSRVSGFTAMLFSVSFGDYEGDGDIDCFMLDPHSREVFKLFLNDSEGNFLPRNRFIRTGHVSVEDNTWNSVKFVDFGGPSGNSIFFTSCAQYQGPANVSSIFDVGEDLLLEAHPTSIGDEVAFLAFTFGDLNSDGYVDAVTMSTGEWCDLSAYINKGGAGFERETISVTNRPLDCYNATSMALADLNNDMMLDIIMVEQDGGLQILLRTGELEFMDHTRESGIDSLTVMGLYYPPAIGDLDNDGDLDIGYFPRLMDSKDVSRIYENDGHARFEDVSAVANIADVSGSPVFFDADDDGDLDIYVAHESEAARKGSKFLVNLHDGNDFIGIDVRGGRRDSFATGATVKLFDEGHIGENEHFKGMRIVGAGDNSIVTNSPGRVHFGAPDGKYDVEVTFPGGKRVVRRGVLSGSRVTIHEAEWPSRGFLALQNAIDTFRGKEAVLTDIMIFLLLSALLVRVLKSAGGVILRERSLAVVLFALLAIVFFYLKYRWIDYGFFQREVFPAVVVVSLFLGTCLPRFISLKWVLRRVGHYKILERIGEGATSVVYKAKNMLTGEHAAVKILHGCLMKEGRNENGFRDEAEIGIGLDNPHLVEIYERGRTGDSAFIAMEYIEGASLSTLMSDGGIFSEDDVLRITLQVLSGLEYLHYNGIIHRDIKSANIMVTEGGNVKITDYGLSKFLFRASSTKPGALVGTLRYMSPEQATGRAVAERSDLYSLGIVMYELLTGHLPFESDNEIEIIHKLLNEETVPPSETGAVTPFTDWLVMKALRKPADERFRDAAEMSRECAVVRRLNQRGFSREQLLRDLDEVSQPDRFLKGDLRWQEPGLEEVLLRQGRLYLNSARHGMEADPPILSDSLRRGRRSVEYLELAGDRDLLLRAHYLLFKVMSRKGNKPEAGKHLGKSFEILEERLSEIKESEKESYMNDQEIVSLLGDADEFIGR